MEKKQKELYRARQGKWLFGVCAGMAEYMNVTPTMMRLVFLLMTLFFGGGIFVYIASIFMFPKKPLEEGIEESYVNPDEQEER